MPLLTELLANFCRWRAKRNTAKAKRALNRAGRWLQLERSIINKGA